MRLEAKLALFNALSKLLLVLLGALALISGWYAGWLPFISGQAI